MIRGEISLVSPDELEIWQDNDRFPGDLVGTWNYETNQEELGLVIEDNRNAEINPFGRESYIRKIRTLIRGSVVALSKWDIHPPGQSKPTIPF